MNYSTHNLLIPSCSTHLCMDVGFGIIYSNNARCTERHEDSQENKVVSNNGPKRRWNCVYLDSKVLLFTDTVWRLWLIWKHPGASGAKHFHSICNNFYTYRTLFHYFAFCSRQGFSKESYVVFRNLILYLQYSQYYALPSLFTAFSQDFLSPHCGNSDMFPPT